MSPHLRHKITKISANCLLNIVNFFLFSTLKFCKFACISKVKSDYVNILSRNDFIILTKAILTQRKEKTHRGNRTRQNTDTVVFIWHLWPYKTPNSRSHENPNRCNQVGICKINNNFTSNEASRCRYFLITFSYKYLIYGTRNADY